MKKSGPCVPLRIPPAVLSGAAIIALLAASPRLRAADAKGSSATETNKPKSKWESVATAGVTLTRGNSKTFLGTLSFNTKRASKSDEMLFGANGGYGESTTTTPAGKLDNVTDSYLKGFGQWNHLFSTQAYGGFRASGEHDDIAHLTYRATFSPLFGYYFIKRPNEFLSAELGPSYIKEKFFGEPEHNYPGLRVGERGEHKFVSGAKVWESVELLPKVEDFANYLVNAEIGVSAPINKALSLSLVVQDTFKSRPATGRLKNDVKLIAGLAYNF